MKTGTGLHVLFAALLVFAGQGVMVCAVPPIKNN